MWSTRRPPASVRAPVGRLGTMDVTVLENRHRHVHLALQLGCIELTRTPLDIAPDPCVLASGSAGRTTNRVALLIAGSPSPSGIGTATRRARFSAPARRSRRASGTRGNVRHAASARGRISPPGPRTRSARGAPPNRNARTPSSVRAATGAGELAALPGRP